MKSKITQNIGLLCFSALSVLGLLACHQETPEEKAQKEVTNALKATTDAVKTASDQVNQAMKTSNEMLQNAQKEMDSTLKSANQMAKDAQAGINNGRRTWPQELLQKKSDDDTGDDDSINEDAETLEEARANSDKMIAEGQNH